MDRKTKYEKYFVGKQSMGKERCRSEEETVSCLVDLVARWWVEFEYTGIYQPKYWLQDCLQG